MKSHKFTNFLLVLAALESACSEPIQNQRDVAGIIKSFEFAYELAWNALKEILAIQGVQTSTPRDVFAKAYQNKVIDQEQNWLELMNDRNRTSHTYDQEFAAQMIERIQKSHLPLLQSLKPLLPN